MKLIFSFIILFFLNLDVYAKTSYFHHGNNKINNSIINPEGSQEEKNDQLTTLEALDKIKWEVGLVAAEALREGLSDWNWGSRSSFKIAHEGWISPYTKSGGADKFGHMYSSYVINELFTKRLMLKTNNKKLAAKKAVLFSSGIMLWLEVADGFSDYGFSYQDVVFNGLGVGFSYLRNTVPNLDKKLDLRISYEPTHNSDRPVIDYSGQTNLLALKLGGSSLYFHMVKWHN